MSNLKKRTYSAFAWDFSGRMVQYLVSFVLSVFLARLLDPKEFGLVAMVMVIINFSKVFIDSGLGVSLIQRKNTTSKHYGSVFWFNVVVGICLTLIFYFTSPLIGKFYAQEELVDLTKALSFIFIINAFGRVASARLAKDLRHNIKVKASFIASVLSGLMGVGLALKGFGVWALIVHSLVNDFLNNLLLVILAKYPFEYQFSFKALRELWSFGFRMFLSAIINRIFQSADNIIIGKLFTPSTLGFFNRGKNLKLLLFNNLAGSLMGVIFPTLSEIQDDNARFIRAVEKSLAIVSFFTFMSIGLLFLIADDMIILVYGDKWAETIPYFKLLLLSAFANPLNSILVTVLSSRGKSNSFLKLELMKKIFMVLVFVFGFYFGIKGFLVGLVINAVFGTVLNIIFAGKELDLSFKWFTSKMWRYLVSALITVSVGYFVFALIDYRLLRLFLSIIIFVILYCGISYVLKASAIKLIINELNLNSKK